MYDMESDELGYITEEVRLHLIYFTVFPFTFHIRSDGVILVICRTRKVQQTGWDLHQTHKLFTLKVKTKIVAGL